MGYKYDGKIIFILAVMTFQIIESLSIRTLKLPKVTCPPDSVCIPHGNCTAVRYNYDGMYTQMDIYNKKCEPFTDKLCCSIEEINYLLPSYCGETSSNRIGANPTLATPFEFPWMALVLAEEINNFNWNSEFVQVCSGFLINKHYALTSAHCVAKNTSNYRVRLAEHNTNSDVDCFDDNDKDCTDVEEYDVTNVIIHDYYNHTTFANDIALLRLDKAVMDSIFVSPICLPINFNVSDDNLGVMEIAGWGQTENGLASFELMKTSVSLTSLKQCKLYYDPSILLDSYHKLCAGGEINEDACKGDSGGPLMASINGKMVAIGIISRGNAHCGSNRQQPGIYERISSHMRWIFENLQP